jgi:hypothetical protein
VTCHNGKVRAALLAIVAGVVLQGCQDTTWRGVVEASPMKGYAEYKTDNGRYSTFADCERAMKAGLRGTVPEQPVPKGYANRTIISMCVQGDTVIEIGRDYNLLPVNPK